MEPLVYVIKGDPIALSRCRIANQRLYDSQKNIKLILGLELARQHEGRRLYTGPLHLDITFFMRIPKKGAPTLDKKFHMYKPDASNLIKLYEDICTGLLYHDDSLISKISAVKLYDNDPRVEFSIIELGKK